jgi:hypothetical protein
MSIILNGTAGVTYPDSVLQASGVPAPSTSGNVLTSNGTTWTSATPASSAGGATQTTTGSTITLTSSSNRVQEITPTANIIVTLPNATTLSKGTPIFTISNVGTTAYTITVNLNGGSSIYYLSAGVGITLALSNNSTSDGTWEINTLPLLTGQGAFAQFDSNNVDTSSYVTPNGYGTGKAWNMALSSTTVLTVYRRASNSYLYAVAGTISGSTITYGTPVLVSSAIAGVSNASWMAVGLSSTTALVMASSTTTAQVAYGLNISGNTITVSTASSAYTVNYVYTNGISKLNSTQCLIAHWNSGTTQYQFNTITHNGTSAPTFGTVSAATTDAVGNVVVLALIPLTATTTFVAYESSTNFILGRVITTSGASAPTLSTSLVTTIAAGGLQNYCNVVPYSATEVAFINGAGTTSFTISGTTVTFQANNTTLTGTTLSYMTPIGWGSSTVGLGLSFATNGAINKFTYATGGSLTKSGLTTTGFGGIQWGNGSINFSNLVPLSSTQYYVTGYSTSNSTGYGAILTLI